MKIKRKRKSFIRKTLKHRINHFVIPIKSLIAIFT